MKLKISCVYTDIVLNVISNVRRNYSLKLNVYKFVVKQTEHAIAKCVKFVCYGPNQL